jgi:GT2 family glycosyltransferase
MSLASRTAGVPSARPLRPPRVSVIVLNYNGASWLERCLVSLRQQTIFDQIEVIVADNNSPDGSDALAREIMRDWRNGTVIQYGENLGFSEGNNRAGEEAQGDYLLFLNNDTWLEQDCLEVLVAECCRSQAQGATPLVMDYADDTFQSLGAAGFDLFGLATARLPHAETRSVLMPEGCSYLIEREAFSRLGGFDPCFFMYAEEYDLSWRVWVAGLKAVAVPAARLHHRGSTSANPQGGPEIVEFRTSDTKRFYTNRNNLLAILKNTRWLWLVLVPLQLALLAAEAIVGACLVRRWGFVKRAYWDAVTDCWRLRSHVLAERRRVRQFRRQGDFWMLHFLRWRLSRWDEVVRIWRLGFPKVTPV